eukprot:5916967-Prymnesium_polylepis.1
MSNERQPLVQLHALAGSVPIEQRCELRGCGTQMKKQSGDLPCVLLVLRGTLKRLLDCLDPQKSTGICAYQERPELGKVQEPCFPSLAGRGHTRERPPPEGRGRGVRHHFQQLMQALGPQAGFQLRQAQPERPRNTVPIAVPDAEDLGLCRSWFAVASRPSHLVSHAQHAASRRFPRARAVSCLLHVIDGVQADEVLVRPSDCEHLQINNDKASHTTSELVLDVELGQSASDDRP